MACNDCSQNTPVASDSCTECSENCPNMYTTECVTLETDLPNLDLVQGQGLTDALEAIDTLLGASAIKIKVTIPSLSVKALFTTPYVILAAPGANYFNEILHISFRMAGTLTTAYTVGAADLRIKGLNATNYMKYISDTILTNTNNAIVSYAHEAAALDDCIRVNESLRLYHATANPTLGTGDLEVYITYMKTSTV